MKLVETPRKWADRQIRATLLMQYDFLATTDGPRYEISDSCRSGSGVF